MRGGIPDVEDILGGGSMSTPGSLAVKASLRDRLLRKMMWVLLMSRVLLRSCVAMKRLGLTLAV